ncbi:MAG: FG-GAP repeat protein, partial [Acidimicrobiales bacterium]
MNDLDLQRGLRTTIDGAAAPVSAAEAQLRAGEATFRRRRRQSGPWTQRLIIVAVTTAIVAVFFVPLPHVSLFRRLITPGKPSTGTSVPITVPKTTPIWKQIVELKGSDTLAGGYFGGGEASEMETTPLEEALSATTAVVGAPFQANQAGRAYVFTMTATGWKQSAELEGSDSVVGDDFGTSVAMSDATIVVGAPYHANDAGGAFAGRVYVFTKTAIGWKQTAELKGSDTVGGDGFGASVAMSGTTLMVGAPFQANETGRVYVFTKTVAGWKQTAELTGSDTIATGDEFGYSIAISGTTAVVSAPNHGAGRAYVFTRTATGWKHVAELKGSDTVAGDAFGDSVSISDATVVVGAPYYANQAGRAYVFTKTTAGWRQTAELTGSDTVAGDQFGWSVAMSGTIAIGAPFH